MKDFLQNLDGKDVAKILKDSSVFVLALGLAFTLYKILTNDLTHLNASMEKQNTAIELQTKVLGSLQDAINQNTQVSRDTMLMFRK